MKAAVGTPTGSRSGQRDGRLEDGDRVVGERADGAAGEARHPLGRLDAAARDERADARRAGRRAVDVSIGRSGRVGRARSTGRVWIRATAVADLEEPARADAEERVAAEALAALDRLEQVGRAAVVEAQEGADRGLEVGRARGAQEDRVGVRRPGACASARLSGSGCGHRGVGLRRIKNDLRLRDERSCLPRCHPHSAMPHSRDRRAGPVSPPPPIGAALYRWRSAPEPTGVRGSRRLAFGPEAPGSIPRRRRPGFHQPPGLSADAATGTRPVHSPFS